MKKIFALLLPFGLAMQAAAPVPRTAPAFTITEPSGHQTSLASLKGKVCVIQFLFTWCPHCQETARQLSALQTEFASKGLVVYGVAFNDQVNTKDVAANKTETSKFSQYAKFPVGLSPRDPVLRFLGLSVMDQFGVPQLVVIDRAGVIQAQTPLQPGAGSLVDPPVMRSVVTNLLNGRPATAPSTSAPPAKDHVATPSATGSTKGQPSPARKKNDD